MFQQIYLYYLYICNKLQFISYNKYYVYSYDVNKDDIQIRNITIIYYMLTMLFMTNNIKVLNYFLIKKDNIIVKNNNEQIFILGNNNFSGVVPNGIIENIKMNIKDNRYELKNLKKNLFKIDHNTPIIFCLAYYENIKNINLCHLSLEYKILFNRGLDNPLLYKVKSNDILKNLFYMS